MKGAEKEARVNVVVQINGRDAIPVRAIPLLTDWEVLSPDVCANAFAGDEDTAQSFEGLPTYRLNSSGEPEAIEARWWANWIVRELAACSELCGEGEAGVKIENLKRRTPTTPEESA